MVLRVDLIFSNWITVWFILYFVGWIKYSPKFAVTIGLLENTYLMFILKTANIQTILSLMVVILIKFIMFYIVRNDKLRKIDIGFSLILFMIYIVWVHINNETFVGYYKKIEDSLNKNDNNTPIVHVINRMLHFWTMKR